MASIFTYEHDIPRVSSPWTKQLALEQSGIAMGLSKPTPVLDFSPARSEPLVTRLESEPQEGPVEYKLHLLLRPRRNYSKVVSIGDRTGSMLAKYGGPAPRSFSEGTLVPPTSTAAALFMTQQTRQHRLEQLTTQLLWRLQQSSPHHTSSASNFVLPCLPEALQELQTPPQPAKLLHGLEESQGALYEIGVSDDGTFVGLAEDEMHESLGNLRAMAASLGCVVEILRMVEVGHSEWTEELACEGVNRPVNRKSKLVVAEALVKPHLVSTTPTPSSATDREWTSSTSSETTLPPTSDQTTSKATSQLRISLTGSTMSGKSSLLGTLSTSTLDNGRGKSRLSMLKHRHEIRSGITSSVTQELVGYRERLVGDLEVVNYATSDISSWIDIHAASSPNGRLIFVSDSAGHPRYRRTIVRGLVGWAPHWTVLCIPADDANDSGGNTNIADGGPASPDVDLSAAHLDLCLRLDLSLVVAVTKLDLASKTGLRATLSKVLSALKSAGRKPILLPNSPGAVTEEGLQSAPNHTVDNIRRTLILPGSEVTSNVPIVLTSAVQGTGIESLHALLHELPIPYGPAVSAQDKQGPIFYIEDVYNKNSELQTLVVSGHLYRGQISVGVELFLGPCSVSANDESSDDSDGQWMRRSSTFQASRSFPGALKPGQHMVSKVQSEGLEWRPVQVTSIRNLRLPVKTLHRDQVGTIGLKLAGKDDALALAALRIRKGMVLAATAVAACSSIVAEIRREDLRSLAVGSQVVLYIASVRASARVVSARIPESDQGSDVVHESLGKLSLAPRNNGSSREDVLDQHRVAGSVTHHTLLVTFSFEASKEYVELGSRVLVMPGGGPGLYGGTERGEKGVAGLEGFVGRVKERFPSS